MNQPHKKSLWFLVPETGEIKSGSKINIGSSVNDFVNNVSEIGGAQVKGLDAPIDLIYLAKDSMGGGVFDVKTKLGAYDGFLLNGEYVTGRDVGNYLAGVNATKAGTGDLVRQKIILDNFYRKFLAIFSFEKEK